MVELRKRKEPTAPAPPPLAKRNSGSGSKIKKLADKAKAAVTSSKPAESSPLATSASTETASATTAPAPAPATNGGNKKATTEKLSEGSQISDLDSFGGTVQTHEGVSVTVKELLEKSTSGVVVFTYPRASTPGCTTQACAFRDSYTPLTDAGLAVYGLSTDSPKSNTTFVTKQKLPYTLLCDPKATLIRAIGMYKGGAGSGTSRGVVVLDKKGVCRVLFMGGPQKTLDAVLEYVKNGGAAIEATSADSAVAASGEAAKVTEPVHTGDTKMLEAPLIKEASRSEEMIAETAAEVGESAKLVDA